MINFNSFGESIALTDQMSVHLKQSTDCFVPKISFFHLEHILSSIERTIGRSWKVFLRGNDWVYDIYWVAKISSMEIWLICNIPDYRKRVLLCSFTWKLNYCNYRGKHQTSIRSRHMVIRQRTKRMVKGVISFSRECWMI